MLQGRSGEVKRQFVADMKGEFDVQNLILDETFIWNIGEKQERRWIIKKVGDNIYEGTAPDVVGVAKGISFGSAFKFEYKLLVPYKDKKIKIRFDDWIFKQDEKTAINKATLTKFGFKVGELTVFFVKDQYLIVFIPFFTNKKYNQFGIIFNNFIIIVKATGK